MIELWQAQLARNKYDRGLDSCKFAYSENIKVREILLSGLSRNPPVFMSWQQINKYCWSASSLKSPRIGLTASLESSYSIVKNVAACQKL
jgi:hypothetical protein